MCVGGGLGAPTVMRGLRAYTPDITGIIGVTDSGRSTGKVRIALDADPSSGVSVYDSTPYQGSSGWWTIGGTSASSPMWAARAADAGVVVNAAYVYGTSITYRDVSSGNNGAPCLVGYDLCTGRGSWTGSTP